MTDPNAYRTASAPSPRRLDVLGLIGVIIGATGLLPSLAVLLIGLVPEMNAIWWLGIVLIPILGFTGLVALVLGVVGLIVAVRRHGRYVLSILAIAIGLLSIAPIGLLSFDSSI